MVESWVQLRLVVVALAVVGLLKGFGKVSEEANFLPDAATNACQTGPRTFGKGISLLSMVLKKRRNGIFAAVLHQYH